MALPHAYVRRLRLGGGWVRGWRRSVCFTLRMSGKRRAPRMIFVLTWPRCVGWGAT